MSATRPLSSTQRTIARRMAEAHATVPDFAVAVDVEMGAAQALRERLRAAGAEPPPSLNDVLVRAVARALREHPRVNASYADAGLVLHDAVDVGIAVATDDALLVPTLRDADRLSLREVAVATRALVARARDRTLAPAELGGATFTISNLGMLGADRFAAIVNPPQAAILAVGAVRDAVVAHDGRPVVVPRATLTLSCDHRVVYGADAARFLARVRALLERPDPLGGDAAGQPRPRP